MIWVFYSLLACNALFFAWQWLERETISAEPIAEAPTESAVNELRLLSEVDPALLRPRTEQEPPTASANASSPQGQQVKPIPQADEAPSAMSVCYRLGPITAGDDRVDELRSWVVTAGGVAQLHLSERRELALYWVYLPPFSAHAEAVRVSREMIRLGIKDIFVIPRGDMAYAISLGVYARTSSLERRLQRLKAKGFEASVLPRYRVEPVSWIDVAFRQAGNLDQQRFRARFPTIEADAISCESVLSDASEVQ